MHRVKIIKEIFMDEHTITINNLCTSITVDIGIVKAVENVSFSIKKGEVFGLVGESGCGKTMTALSIMGLVPSPGRIVSGEIIFEGRDITRLNEKEMQDIRGNKIGMIFQEPMTALNPVLRIGEQIAETIKIHNNAGNMEIKDRVLKLLKQVGFDEPEKKFAQYPHQLSGGQRQRVLIAIAISCNPLLLIADEPTTALDIATESQILSLLNGLIVEYGMSMLFITHNLHIIRKLAQNIGIMYAGRLIEKNNVEDFFSEPLHPYSRGLVDSIVGLSGKEKRLKTIPGFVPRLSEMPEGCKFHPRCNKVMPQCMINEPPMFTIGNEKWIKCFLYQG
ncbi:MAG TPA: ABC transporter ATP-binding protein [Syntrophorhabdaceae bacterium]|nr:ABC transporter ATP-binding protein [Syntrophorhabdaceae bacterium]